MNVGGSLEEWWNPVTQCYYNYAVAFDWCFSWKFKAGCEGRLRTETWELIDNSTGRLLAGPRMLYGELMIPVYQEGVENFNTLFRFGDGWDEETNTMTLTLWKASPPNVS